MGENNVVNQSLKVQHPLLIFDRSLWMHAFQSSQSVKYQFLLEYKDSSPNMEDRLVALNTVTRLDVIDQLRLVIEGLNDIYHTVRAKAIDALTLADASVREHWLVRQKLKEKLNDRSVKVRQSVFLTLGQLKDPPLYLLLRSSMFDRHEKIQDSIGEIFYPYIDWVIQILVDDTKQAWLRSAAAHVLGKIGNSEALKVLFLVVKDELTPKYLKRDVKRALSDLESQYGKKNEEGPSYSINESSNLRPKGNRRYYITSAIKKGINNALLNHQSYPLKWKCPECRGYTTDQLPLAARSVRTNMNIQGYSADIVILNDINEPLVVIEVTFTVHPREKSRRLIEQLDIPVFIYWPKSKWTTREDSEYHLERLEKGLTGIEGDRILGYNLQCHSPRHPPLHYPVSNCSHCQHERKLVTLEVWDNYQCANKKCMSPMFVLRGWRRTCRTVYPGLLEPAKELGVNLQIKYSKYRNHYYVVHPCPKCKNEKFHCPERGKYDLSPPGHPLRVGFYGWCPKCDKWGKLGIIKWNEMASNRAEILIGLTSD